MKKEISHFWIGNFKSETEFNKFFGENSNYYDDDEIDTDEKYISEFAKTQNEHHLDYDFFECGFENENLTFEKKFAKYSYSEQWLSVLQSRIEQIKIDFEINAIAFISKVEIENSTSIKSKDFEITYLGIIEYNI